MNRTRLILLLVVLSGNAFGLPAPVTLNGELIISKEPLTDPLPDGDSAAYISLHGKEAKLMYEGMKAQDFQNACGLQGVTARVAGNLICYNDKNENYSCSFGIRLTDGALILGKPC